MPLVLPKLVQCLPQLLSHQCTLLRLVLSLEACRYPLYDQKKNNGKYNYKQCQKQSSQSWLTCTMAAAGPNHVSAVMYAINRTPKEEAGVGAINTPSILGAARTCESLVN